MQKRKWIGLLGAFILLGTSFCMEPLLELSYMKEVVHLCGMAKKINGFEKKKPVFATKEVRAKKENNTNTMVGLMENENKEERENLQEFVERQAGGITALPVVTEQPVMEPVSSLVENLVKKGNKYMLKNFYIVDGSTSVDPSVFSIKDFLKYDFSLQQIPEPQILIYHTHGGSECYKGKKGENSVIDAGNVLEEKLNAYGYYVIHDKTRYDCVDGKINRNLAYSEALKGIKVTLKKYPSIQVVIDLHRDGTAGRESRTTEIDGKSVAQFMIFNGLSRNQNGDIPYLHNDKLQANLAFGFQVKMATMARYPDLTIQNYLKAYRYNLHLRERSLLIELGDQNNTMEEAKNTMPYLAEVLHAVLQGEISQYGKLQRGE